MVGMFCLVCGLHLPSFLFWNISNLKECNFAAMFRSLVDSPFAKMGRFAIIKPSNNKQYSS